MMLSLLILCFCSLVTPSVTAGNGQPSGTLWQPGDVAQYSSSLVSFEDVAHLSDEALDDLNNDGQIVSRSQQTPPPFLRGVNIGGWLVLEKWLTPNVFKGTSAGDQWTFDATPGAREKLRTHWETFFTAADVRKIKSWGFNALRIPIGFWAFDSAGTPYMSGADAYLERALGWARSAGMLVWIDLHGVPGSQNGYDNSGHAGTAQWHTGNNLDRTISVLQTMARKYGANAYSDVVAGIELVNEPISWAPNKFTRTQEWTVRAVKAVRSAAANKDLNVVMHDSFQPAKYWKKYIQQIYDGGAQGRFALDTHLYQVFDEQYKSMDVEQHVRAACDWGVKRLQQATARPTSVPIYVGEWSAAMDVCVNPDGSSFAGKSTSKDCEKPGCQCTADTDSAKFSGATKAAVRRYMNAQLATWNKYTSGFFYWNFKGPGVWSLYNGISQGWIPNPITSFENVC